MSTKGFTLVEVLVVVAIGVVLATSGFIGFNKFRDQKDIQLSLNEMAEAAREARSKSVTQEEGSRWSIRFVSTSTGSDYYQIFQGGSYSTSSVTAHHSFRRNVFFSEPTDDRSVDMLFQPLTGELDGSQVVSVSRTGGAGTVGDLFVRSTGLIGKALYTQMAGYWHFEEGSGSVLADASGFNRDGSFVNSPSWVAPSGCILGACLDFNASGWVSLPSEIDFSEDAPWTVMYWFYHDSATSDDMTLGVYDENANRLYHRDTGTAYKIRWHNNAAEYHDFEFGSDLRQAWHHVAITADGSDADNMRFYVDGVGVSTSTQANSRFIIDVIGNPHTTTSYIWDGKLDEVMLFTRALSADEISEYYTNLK